MYDGLKLNSLDDLKKYNLIVLDKQRPIKNNVKKVLLEKGLNQSDLSELTGICRQNISEIVNDEMIPGVVLASQIAKVLNTPVEELFELTEDAWIKIAKVNKDTTLYIDLYDLKILNNKDRKAYIKETGLEYIDITNNRCITKEEYENKLNSFILDKNGDTKRVKWTIKKEILDEFEKYYINRYRKLGERIKPLIQE